jgi:hypothetical protein
VEQRKARLNQVRLAHHVFDRTRPIRTASGAHARSRLAGGVLDADRLDTFFHDRVLPPILLAIAACFSGTSRE